MTNMNLDTAEGWRPEAGDFLVGEVTDISRALNWNSDGYYPIVTIKVEKGTSGGNDVSDTLVAVHCFHAILANRMVELRPKVGETIGVKFVRGSEKPKKKGEKHTPAVYNVRIKGRSADSIWDSMPSNLPLKSDIPESDVNSNAEDFIAGAVTQEDDDIPF